MRVKGQAAPVSLEVLRVWLGRLLGLGKPPSVAECADGRLLRAALAKMQSSQPALSAAPAALLSAVAPQDATFAALAGELDAAGLGQPPGVLDAAAAGDTATLEGLLLTIYQYYAHNHAHKFSKPITQPPPLPPLLPSSGGGGQPLPAVTPLPGRPHVSATGELLAPGPTTAKQHQPSASEAAEPAHPDSSWNKRPPGSAELLACGLGLPDERWMAATQTSLAVWLGTAAGRHDPVGRMLLSSASVEAKLTMLENGAAHRSAAAALFGSRLPGSHASLDAGANASETLASLEAAGYQVWGDAVSALLAAEPIRLSLRGQLVLGAVVLQVALEKQDEQQGQERTPDAPGQPASILAWAQRQLADAGVSHRASVEAWGWVELAQLAAACLGSSEPAGRAGAAAAFHELDALCSSHGLVLPFAAGDLPGGLPGNSCLQLVMAAFLGQLRQAHSAALHPHACAAASPTAPPSAAPPEVELSCDVVQQDSAEEICSADASPDTLGDSNVAALGSPSASNNPPPSISGDDSAQDGSRSSLAASLEALDAVVTSAAAMATASSADSASLGDARDAPGARIATAKPEDPGAECSPSGGLPPPPRPVSRGSRVDASLPAGLPRPVTASRPHSSRGQSGGRLLGEDLETEASLSADSPQHLPSYGSMAEVLTIAEEEEEDDAAAVGEREREAGLPTAAQHRHPAVPKLRTLEQLPPHVPPGPSVQPSPAGPGARGVAQPGGLRPSTASRSAAGSRAPLRGSLVPVDMFAPPPPAVEGLRPGSEPLASMASSLRGSGFLQPNVFDAPQLSAAYHCHPPRSPEASLDTRLDGRMSAESPPAYVEVEGGIGRFRARRGQVSASVAQPGHRGFCPDLSASTPHLELPPPLPRMGGAEDELEGGREAQEGAEIFADTLDAAAAEEIVASASADELGPPPAPGLTTSAVQLSPVRLAPPVGLRLPQGRTAAPAPLRDSVDGFEATLNPRLVGPLVAAAAEVGAEATAPEAHPLELSLNQAAPQLPEPRSSEALPEGPAAPADAAGASPPLLVGPVVPPAASCAAPAGSPAILASGAGAPAMSAARRRRSDSREILAMGAGMAVGAEEERPEVAARAPGPLPPPVEEPVAFEVGVRVGEGAHADAEALAKEEERLRRVQAMLDAKRERFLAERKERELAAAEAAAREERQRRALARQREIDAGATRRRLRAAAEEAAITKAAAAAEQELGVRLGASEKSAAGVVPSAEVSVIAQPRPREQMLAETSLPLEEHLARLVAAAAVTEADPPSAFVDEAAAGSEGPAEAAGDVARRQLSARHHGLAPPSFSRASNRKLVRNALAHVCLAGGARAKEKEAALAAMDAVKGDDSFIVLFKGPAAPLHFKGLYLHRRASGAVERLFGKGPDALDPGRVATYFKYDSGAREFRPMQTTAFNFGTTAGVAQS
eukprot:jgi/Tetstr1/466144/TSEL_010705.t1